ncbi:hypothetical protein BGZ97_000551 [Linnemannia gamsii]|uniref:Uncharacterized protein n=1 Tax=Linnemannia gamsii TaxID=64522 RepID=A0A9P6RNL2_9FUNG|nr:hypothetical protein BGZ97_000551 [Linnemannia gamsii]
MQLLRDPSRGGGGRQTPWLSMANQSISACAQATPERQADFGQLRGFTRTCLAAYNHDLMRGNRGGNCHTFA